jgi:hypothetical protein
MRTRLRESAVLLNGGAKDADVVARQIGGRKVADHLCGTIARHSAKRTSILPLSRGLTWSGEWTGSHQPERPWLLGCHSSLYIYVDGAGDVMDESGMPLLVRLQVCGERVAVRAFLTGEALFLSLLHGAAPPQRKGIRLHRGTNQTRSPLPSVYRVFDEVFTADLARYIADALVKTAAAPGPFDSRWPLPMQAGGIRWHGRPPIGVGASCALGRAGFAIARCLIAGVLSAVAADARARWRKQSRRGPMPLSPLLPR